jgi:ketosteroid isomerase-like protein
MTPEENKEVVHRFWNELIVGGKVEVADELLTPDYVNLIVERLGDNETFSGPEHIDPKRNGVDHLKRAIADWHEAVESAEFEILAMVASDDDVLARFNMTTKMRDGTTASSRGLGYYQLRDGKIALNDVLTVAR